MPLPFWHRRLAASALSRGAVAQKEIEYLPKISEAETLGGAGHRQGAKHRRCRTKMQAVRSGTV